MIALARPDEPPVLREKRPGKLAAARDALSRGEKITFTGYGDEGVKDALFQAQHRKCAYCEKPEEQAKYRETEHFRPKAHYWWLAWTWENLLFACFDCNREHKREQFPLVDEAARLAAEEVPPGREKPLLIDPFEPGVDPAREIEFRRARISGRERWMPYGLTDRGRETIRVCGLDRPGLLTLYVKHVNDVVRPKVEALRRVVETGSAQEVVRQWGTLRRGVLGSYQPFHALARDAIKVLVAPALRAQYNLAL